MMWVFIIALCIALGVPAAIWGGGIAYSSIQPRRELKQIERNKEQEKQKEGQRLIEKLDPAVRKLAEHDVKVAQGKMEEKKDITDFLYYGDSLRIAKTRDGIDYINEKYSEYFTQETQKQMGERLIESELSAFDELRDSHIRAAEQLERAREDMRTASKKSSLDAEFDALTADTTKSEVR